MLESACTLLSSTLLHLTNCRGDHAHYSYMAGKCALHILTVAFLQAARNQGFTFGVQFKPEGLVSFPTEYLQHRSLSQLPQDAAQHISYALAYSPEGQSTFGKTKLVSLQVQ